MAQTAMQPLHVLVAPDQVDAIASMSVGLGPYTQRGSTTNFDVYYDNSLGGEGQTLADAVLARCEQDYQQLQAWFGGITAGRFSVYIDPGTFGAYHASCDATELHLSASGANGDLENMLNVAEVDEVFMARQNAGWDCGSSSGEGLSRVLATERYPAQLDGYASAASWLDSNPRPDWVNNTESTDRNYVSIGCAALFINYLHYQLGFSLTQVVAAAAPTLAGVYTKLTGRTDGFARFNALLQTRFPVGHPSGLSNDNPFPIGSRTHFYTADANERQNAIANLGFNDEGVACYVFSAPPAGPAPLYRAYQPATNAHFYTMSIAERDNATNNLGYVAEGITGYVFGPQVPNSVPLYRAYRGASDDHFYTTSAAEHLNAVQNLGYGDEGIAGYVLPSPVSGAVPLYRLFKGAHFYTADANERQNAIQNLGFADEGIACYIMSAPPPGPAPLFRAFHPSTGAHFYTMSIAERDNATSKLGYRAEGIACYLFGQQVAGSSPLYRAYQPATDDHFYTANLAEHTNAVQHLGYSDEGVTGDAPDSSSAGVVPFYRMYSP